MLFLRGAELVLRPSVITIFDLDEVNVTLKNADIFGSMLSGCLGKVDLLMANGWRCMRCSWSPSVAPCHS